MTSSEQPPKVPAIMTYEEYAGREWPRWPYVFELEANGNTLVYFGERHSFDPDDEQWNEVRELWQRFISSTEGRKRIALVEGGVRSPQSNERESILSDGGMGLLTYLAHGDGVETATPEPAPAEVFQSLETKFSREAIAYYEFANVAYQWYKTEEPRPTLEVYARGFLARDKKISGWEDVDFSYQGMQAIHARLFPDTPFDQDNRDFFDHIVDPVETDTLINQVARATSEMRDRHIAEEILRYIKEGYSVFAEYGGSHVVMQEPFLRALLKS